MDVLVNEIELLASKIVKSISNSDELKSMLKHKDMRGNNSIYYMSLYHVYNVLDTKCSDRILQDFWKSNIDVTGNILECSTAFRLIFS